MREPCGGSASPTEVTVPTGEGPRRRLIVARGRPAFLQFVRMTFSAKGDVDITLDRRASDRRSQFRFRVLERRRSDRRLRTDVDAQLRAAGYALVERENASPASASRVI